MDKIKIGGKNRPISFGMAALAIFCRQKGVSLAGFADSFAEMDLIDTFELIKIALENGSKEDLGITWRDVADWIDKRPESLGDAISILENSMTVVTESLGGEVESDSGK